MLVSGKAVWLVGSWGNLVIFILVSPCCRLTAFHFRYLCSLFAPQPAAFMCAVDWTDSGQTIAIVTVVHSPTA